METATWGLRLRVALEDLGGYVGDHGKKMETTGITVVIYDLTNEAISYYILV